MKAHLLVAIGALVAGCASHTGVVEMGRDTYMIAKQQATGYPGLGNMKGEIIAEGNAYCRAQGKQFKLQNTFETQPPYVLGNYPRSEIHFTCLSMDDPAAARTVMQRAPDQVIETRQR